MFSIISKRDTSAFPISVGTSLALESAIVSNKPSIDPDRKIPQKINLVDYDEVWINIGTLFRNLVSSLTKDDSSRVHPSELAMGLLNEIDIIKDIIAEDTFNKVKVVFYVCEYRDINKNKLKHAILRSDNTELQKLYRSNYVKSIQEVINKIGKSVDPPRLFNSELKTTSYKKAIIITHIAYDLLSSKNFRELHLLESHTGVLKRPHQFNTKYYDGKKYPMMPFNLALLQVFGDSEHFRPFPIKLRETIIELANQYKWTPATTEDKLKYSINSMKDHYAREILKEMF